MAEKLNINTTPPTLFVGVGGIGSQIVLKVAKRCKDGEAKNIRFVVMDTNANDLDDVVHSSSGTIVPIQTSSTQTVKDYLVVDKDAREEWFPNNSTLYGKSVSEGAGQVRAISRLALNAMSKTGKLQPMYKAIDDLFLKDGGDLKQALRVVVVSSISGGTGSGIALPISMMIRDYLYNHYREKAAIIRGFFLLPGVLDTVISSETEKQSLRRNGYATIKEINAFMIKGSGFCEVRKELERYKDIHIDVPLPTGGIQRLDNLPFDFAFLLDRMDQRQESMQSLDQYKEFAAQSLYEQHIGPMQKTAFSQDDNIIKEFSNHDNLGRNRFGGIGASVLKYPYEDIADYIAYGRAIERIGDGEEAGQWMKYDQAYKSKMAEYKTKRSMSNEDEPKIEDVYVSAVNNDESRFGKDIKSYISNDVEGIALAVNKELEKFVKAFIKEVTTSVVKTPGCQDTTLKSISNQTNYAENEEDRVSVDENFQAIRGYEQTIKRTAVNIGKARAKAILYDAPSIKQDVKPYHLETILKTHEGGIHPNAARYLLYSLKMKVQTMYEKCKKSEIDLATQQLEMYSAGARSADFDLKKTKDEETSLDQLVTLASSDGEGKSRFSKKSELWVALTEHMVAYADRVIVYRDAIIKEAALFVILEYLESILKEYEDFYASFSVKVMDLSRRQEDIIDGLKFSRGDSVRYICGTKKHLDRLYEMCPEGSDGLMLPAELNSDIFDAIKKNAESSRLSNYDPTGDYPKADIFDEVLIGYFKESVREDCAEVIDLDVIKALLTEQKFDEYFKANSLLQDGEKPIVPVISDDVRMAYLKSSIKRGQQLAAPGISVSGFVEERKIQACSYNVALKDSRTVNMHKLLETMTISPVASDTVSKYELRFFNAIYNISADKLTKFRAPVDGQDEVEKDQAGIYYRAYREHAKRLGPDSTKSAAISLHIDKRWDSLTELPEMSLKAHYEEMVKIHSALIYGVVHGLIKTYPSSTYDKHKRIFELEDLDGDLTKFTVSNKTECDEFYEVLDALYRDMASVAKIYDMAEERRKHDEESNCRFEESNFAKDVETFIIGDGHEGPTSLFEIPLMYFNSLPRAKMDDNELAIMVDSVIDVMKNEVSRFEKDEDINPFLADQLTAQFELLIKNYKNDDYDVDGCMRKNLSIKDNFVLNVVFRKVSKKLKELNAYRFEEKIRELRSLMA